MKELLIAACESSRKLQDSSATFNAYVALIRATLQCAAITLIEHCVKLGCIQDDPAFSDVASQLLQPADGVPGGAIDLFLPQLRQSGWPGCASPWFDQRGKQPPLCRRVEEWVRFRNDRPGHGIVDNSTVKAGIELMGPLCRDLVEGLSDLLPKLQADGSLRLVAPDIDTPIQTVRTIGGEFCLIRSISRKGSAWRVKYQTLNFERSMEGTYEIPTSSALPVLSSSTPRLYRASVIKGNGWEWRPTILLPQRQTTAFKGRTTELASLAEWFGNFESRACIVYGEGGIGKTTLVLEALNELLENSASAPLWRPSVITFYSAKLTYWGPEGLEHVKGLSPAVAEAVRLVVRVLEERLDKKWFLPDTLALIDKAASLLSDAGLKRDDLLLVLDNTETLTRASGEEDVFGRVLQKVATRLCRLLITSRRREKVEAFPIQVLQMEENIGASLLRELAALYGAQSLLAAGEARLKKVSRQLSGRPLLLDVCARFASQGGRSIDDSVGLVLREAQRDLGEFLFEDAWQRLSTEHRVVFLVVGEFGGSLDGRGLGWICEAAGIALSVWEEGFLETRFGSFHDYGTRYDIQLEAGMTEFLKKKLTALDAIQQSQVRQIHASVDKKLSQLVLAATRDISDRVAVAFRTAAAKAAKLAADAGNIDDAILWYEEAVRVDSQNHALWDRYAWFLLIKGHDLVRAHECALESCRLGPSDSDAHFTAGLVAARRGDFVEADRLLLRAEELGKAAHLCALQSARARLVYVQNADNPDWQQHLNQAAALLKIAQRVSPKEPVMLAKKHLEEVQQTETRLARVFRTKSQNPTAPKAT